MFDSLSPILIYGVAATMLPAGGICIAFGVIGRRVSEHPSCRACSFDLVGTWPRSRICPECGASLEQSHAVVDGVHEMRRGLLALGAALFILGLAMHISYFASQMGADSIFRSNAGSRAASGSAQAAPSKTAGGDAGAGNHTEADPAVDVDADPHADHVAVPGNQ